MINLRVEVNQNFIKAHDVIKSGKGLIAITPPIDEGYWIFRVPLTEKQAIIAFPKFFTMGIGFQIEEADWNTNLPYASPAEEIYKHIECNKGDDSITKETCIKAIRSIQDTIKTVLEKQRGI